MKCDEFQEQVDDLALGQLEEPRRSELLLHASGCQSCQALLSGLGAVADRLLLAAPQIEPPAGFESRALARMGSPASPQRAWWVSAIGGLVIVVAGLVAWWSWSARETPNVVAAPIMAESGSDIGVVELRADPSPHVLVVIDSPRPDPGTRTCQLQRGDGDWVTVGSWEVEDIAAGVWAVGVESALLEATAMRVLTADGSVLATADLSG